MKKLRLLYLSLFIIGFISTISIFGETEGDFRSAVVTGDWGTPGTWQIYTSGSWVASTSLTPSSSSAAAVTILNGHTITITASVSVRNVTINLGGKVAISGTATTGLLTVTDEGMTVNGSLDINGTAPSAAPYTVTMTAPAVLTIGSTGVVNYNQGGSTNALPIATWSTGSTLNITGIVATTSFKAGGAQKFYNLNWNCPSQTGNFGWSFKALSDSVIYGDVTISNTGAGRVQFFASNSGRLDIMGDLNVTGSANATTNGTSSGSFDTLFVHGIVDVNTSGNFSISRGSQAGVGTSTLVFYNDVTIIAGTMGNSNTTPDGARFVFKKNGIQNLIITPTTMTGNAIPIEVDTGSTVNLLSTVNVTTLYLYGGKIISSASHPLVMGWWNSGTSTLTSGSVSPLYAPSPVSYVDGPMSYLYATAAGATSKMFPLGKGGICRPLTLSLTQTDAILSTYTAEIFNAAPPSNALSGTLTNVSSVRYYTVSEVAGGSAFTAGSIKLSYDNGDGATNLANLRVAQGSSAGGGSWVDLGGTGTGSPTGTITSSIPFTALTNTIFTLGNVNNGCTLTLKAIFESLWVGGGETAMTITPDVTVELRDGTTFALVESQTATLSTAGVGTFTFATALDATPYYIVVKSANTLETWSATAVSFSGGALSYDFTTGLDKAFTSGICDPLANYSGVFCIYSGDVNQDTYITGDDATGIDNDNTNFDYHAVNDVNGDGYITGDDNTSIDNNNAGFIQAQWPDGATPLAKRVIRSHVQTKHSVTKSVTK